jgi:hypothetical protein
MRGEEIKSLVFRNKKARLFVLGLKEAKLIDFP